MSDRKADQALSSIIDQIREGIFDFSKAVQARIDSGEWRDSHIDELHTLRVKLLEMDISLKKLEDETW